MGKEITCFTVWNSSIHQVNTARWGTPTMAELLGWMEPCAPEVLCHTPGNPGSVPSREGSRSGSQTQSDSWNLSSDFRYRSGYLNLLPSKLSLWKDYGVFLMGQVLQQRRDEAPVCFRMRTHTAVLTDCVHTQSWEGLFMHLTVHYNSAWLRQNQHLPQNLLYYICFSWSQTINVWDKSFRSNTKVWIWQHHV